MPNEFLSDDWMEAVKAIREKYADQAPPVPYKIRMNQVISGAPFNDGADIHSTWTPRTATMKLEKGELEDPEVTVSTDWETARKIFVDQDQAAGMQAFMSGKIKVQGDMTKLMMMNAVPPDELTKSVAARDQGDDGLSCVSERCDPSARAAGMADSQIGTGTACCSSGRGEASVSMSGDLPPPDPSQRNLYEPGWSVPPDRAAELRPAPPRPIAVGGIAMVVFAIGLGLVVLRDNGGGRAPARPRAPRPPRHEPPPETARPATAATASRPTTPTRLPPPARGRCASTGRRTPTTTRATPHPPPPRRPPPTTTPTPATTTAAAAARPRLTPEPTAAAVATAQALLDAFANGRWNDARTLNPGRNESDAFLQSAYGPIEQATIVPAAVDRRERWTATTCASASCRTRTSPPASRRCSCAPTGRSTAQMTVVDRHQSRRLWTRARLRVERRDLRGYAKSSSEPAELTRRSPAKLAQLGSTAPPPTVAAGAEWAPAAPAPRPARRPSTGRSARRPSPNSHVLTMRHRAALHEERLAVERAVGRGQVGDERARCWPGPRCRTRPPRSAAWIMSPRPGRRQREAGAGGGRDAVALHAVARRAPWRRSG